VRRALAPGELKTILREVDADDPLGTLEPAARDGAEPDHPRTKDDTRRSGRDLRGVDRRAEPGGEPARE
jgi:hypothetical protein